MYQFQKTPRISYFFSLMTSPSTLLQIVKRTFGLSFISLVFHSHKVKAYSTKKKYKGKTHL